MRFVKFFLFLFLVFLVSGCTTDQNGSDVVLSDPHANMVVHNNLSAGQLFISDTIFEDLRFPVSAIRLLGQPADPDIIPFIGGTITLAFSPTSVEEVFVTMQFPHGKKDNSTLYPHFHWSPSDVTAGTVVWCLEYTCANINDVFPLTDDLCVADVASGVANSHQMSGMIVFNNNLSTSSMCVMRVYRDTTNVSDDYNSDAYLHEFDIHYQVEKLGEEEI